MNNNRRERFVLRYTLMFAFVAVAVLSVFVLNGRSLIRGLDGPAQHYAALRYLGEWLRTGLSGGGWKMIDFSLGQGMDVLTTLSYYCFTEPLAMISALVPAEYTEYLYAALLFARFYLAGLFAAMLARCHGAKGWTAAVAGLLYGCGSFMAAGGLWHFNFGVGLVLLPLMLLAVERVFRTGRWRAYVAVVALQLMSSFYFAYMNTVIAIVYILVRLAQEMTSKREIPRCARVGTKLLGGYVLGAAVSAVVFLPVAMAYLGGGRGALETGAGRSMLHYSMSFYKELFTGFFGRVNAPGTWTLVGYAPLVAIAASVFLFKRERTTAAIRAMLCICGLMLCVPAVGKVMNGMGYPSNRWCYALELFLVLAAARGVEDAEGFAKKKTLAMSVLWMVYGALCFVLVRSKEALVVAALFAVTSALFAASGCGWLKGRGFRTAVCALTVVSVSASAVLMYAPQGDGMVSNYLPWNYVDADENERLSAFKNSAEEDFYRVDGAFLTDDHYKGFVGGHAPMLNYRGVSYYWSITPALVSDHYVNTWSNSLIYYHLLHGMGGDSGMNLLASVKYILAARENGEALPQGFEVVESFVGEDGLHYDVLENRFALPLGYTFDSWMSEEDYEQLSAIEKRDALLRAAVVESEVLGLAECASGLAVQKLDVQFDGNTLENGAKIVCELPGEGEVFVTVAAPKMLGSAEFFDLTGPAGSNRAYISNASSNFAYPQQGVILPMGVCDAGKAEFVFGMSAPFGIESVEVWYRPSETYEAAAKKLGEDVLENVTVGTNYVCGEISLEEPKWLQLSIPYSEGWTATVDGEPVELVRSGGMYMGLALETGEHFVELEYFTPHLAVGLFVSLIACFVWVVLSLADDILHGRNRKK